MEGETWEPIIILEEHLNRNPSLENQLNGCKFAVVVVPALSHFYPPK